MHEPACQYVTKYYVWCVITKMCVIKSGYALLMSKLSLLLTPSLTSPEATDMPLCACVVDVCVYNMYALYCNYMAS